MRKYRSLSAAVFVVVLCALIGGLSGRRALAQDQLDQQYRVLADALQAIEDNYVGEAESDRLVYSAISGMLQTLDPHSSFMSPSDYRQMRERQEGRYFGLGIQIGAVDGDLTISQVFEGSPAYEKGLRRGDVIARIEKDDTKGWTTNQAVDKLRGPRGTSVNIGVRRIGYDKLIDLQVPRDAVLMATVPVAVMLDASTGYIRVSDFGENTDRELGDGLRDLTRKGMKRLVFDLRENPGGALDQAIKVTNRFIAKGKLVVSTRGRVQNSDQDYHATESSDYLNLPMLTLVNRNSASASEIVSGALQDYDRSLIVGETTFGKALVQSVYKVSQNAGAAITTARYITPSGRMIQRPWDGTFDDYLAYRYREQDVNKAHSDKDLKHTVVLGRKVYSGGGVEPDERFDGPVEGFNPSRFGRTLYARNLFGRYAQRFARRGDTRIPPGPTTKVVGPDYEVTPEMVAEFKEMAKKEPIKWDEAAWEKDQDFIKAMIRNDIDVDLFGLSTAYLNLAKRDPQLQFALTKFGEAQSLLDQSRQSSTARRASR
ncbi:MAG TPA: S41 family peptidase [Vicinamibacterales bacterium]|nr:S41 family peptidase [Vicinamibacterales bacterium]